MPLDYRLQVVHHPDVATDPQWRRVAGIGELKRTLLGIDHAVHRGDEHQFVEFAENTAEQTVYAQGGRSGSRHISEHSE